MNELPKHLPVIRDAFQKWEALKDIPPKLNAIYMGVHKEAEDGIQEDWGLLFDSDMQLINTVEFMSAVLTPVVLEIMFVPYVLPLEQWSGKENLEPVWVNPDYIIAKVEAWQDNPQVHPLTCGNDSGHQPLVAIAEEWDVNLKCLDCDYKQTWIPPSIYVYEGAKDAE
jgi:hypothetical protein